MAGSSELADAIEVVVATFQGVVLLHKTYPSPPLAHELLLEVYLAHRQHLEPILQQGGSLELEYLHGRLVQRDERIATSSWLILCSSMYGTGGQSPIEVDVTVVLPGGGRVPMQRFMTPPLASDVLRSSLRFTRVTDRDNRLRLVAQGEMRETQGRRRMFRRVLDGQERITQNCSLTVERPLEVTVVSLAGRVMVRQLFADPPHVMDLMDSIWQAIYEGQENPWVRFRIIDSTGTELSEHNRLRSDCTLTLCKTGLLMTEPETRTMDALLDFSNSPAPGSAHQVAERSRLSRLLAVRICQNLRDLFDRDAEPGQQVSRENSRIFQRLYVQRMMLWAQAFNDFLSNFVTTCAGQNRLLKRAISQMERESSGIFRTPLAGCLDEGFIGRHAIHCINTVLNRLAVRVQNRRRSRRPDFVDYRVVGNEDMQLNVPLTQQAEQRLQQLERMFQLQREFPDAENLPEGAWDWDLDDA